MYRCLILILLHRNQVWPCAVLSKAKRSNCFLRVYPIPSDTVFPWASGPPEYKCLLPLFKILILLFYKYYLSEALFGVLILKLGDVGSGSHDMPRYHQRNEMGVRLHLGCLGHHVAPRAVRNIELRLTPKFGFRRLTQFDIPDGSWRHLTHANFRFR